MQAKIRDSLHLEQEKIKGLIETYEDLQKEVIQMSYGYTLIY